MISARVCVNGYSWPHWNLWNRGYWCTNCNQHSVYNDTPHHVVLHFQVTWYTSVIHFTTKDYKGFTKLFFFKRIGQIQISEHHSVSNIFCKF